MTEIGFIRTLPMGAMGDNRTSMDSFFEDARSSVQLIARQCIDLYDRHHRLLQPPFAQPPILTCRECRSPVDVPSDKQQQDYEYCIEQAEAWMNRAVSMRK